MGFKNNQNRNQNLPTLDLTNVTVKHCRVVTDTMVSFMLSLPGLSLYGMKLIEGKNGYFIAPPSHKGSDGNWYQDYAVYLSKEDEQTLIDTVTLKLNENA